MIFGRLNQNLKMMSEFDDIEGDVTGAIEPASEAGNAFNTSGSHTFKGVALKPFSGLRMRLAEILHLRFFSVLQQAAGDPDVMDSLKRGTYDGLQQDTAIVLFLCSRPRSGIEWGFGSPTKLLREVNNWADDAGICRGNPAFEAAAETAMGILFEIINVMPGEDGGGGKAEAEDDAPKKKS